MLVSSLLLLTHIEGLRAVLTLDVVVGPVAEAVAPSAALCHELGSAFQARVQRLVRVHLLVVNLPVQSNFKILKNS